MADPIRRRPPGLTLLVLAVGLAAGPLPAQSPGPVGRTQAEEAQLWRRRAQPALRLGPVLLSSDRIFAGDKVFIHSSLLNKEVEDLVLYRGTEVNQSARVEVYLEKIGGQAEIVSWESGRKAQRKGRRYFLSASYSWGSAGRPTADGDWVYESASYSPVISRLGAMPFRERWLVAISPVDTSGFPIGAYEITVDLIIGSGTEPLDSRKARFTVLPR